MTDAAAVTPAAAASSFQNTTLHLYHNLIRIRTVQVRIHNDDDDDDSDEVKSQRPAILRYNFQQFI